MKVTEAKQFVLVHGAWGGSWIWKMTADSLIARGHSVLAPTLTGLGERSHLASYDVNLSTHIRDVANCIRWEDLDRSGITLVGHSYGGAVISGVAEKVPEGTIDSIVYLDALMPPDGESVYSYFGRSTDDLPETLPPREQVGDYLPENWRVWIQSKLTPHPVACFTEPLKLTGAVEKIRVKTYIRASDTTIDLPNQGLQNLKDDPSWRYEELPCGHDTQVAMPVETADALERAALA
jgi:pimeloyl-ACP methyl ester carboxylesterase